MHLIPTNVPDITLFYVNIVNIIKKKIAKL